MGRAYLSGLFTAALLWLGWPPHSFTAPILLVALVPLLGAVESIIHSQAEKKGRSIFALCFFTFAIWNTSCIYWVYNALSAVNNAFVASLISIVPFGLAALLMTCAFWLYYRMRLRLPKPLAYAALICFWIAYEYLHQSWDLAFPWMTLGNGFAQSHKLVQWYEYTGVYGGSIWILLANILTFELALQKENSAAALKLKKWKVLALAVWVLLPLGISLIIYTTYREKPNPANIVVVQPNIDPYGKWNTIPSEQQVQHLIHLSDSVAQSNTEFFIWPETAVPRELDEDQMAGNPEVGMIRDFLSRYQNGNVLTGLESYRFYKKAQTPTARLSEQYGMYFDIFNAAANFENSGRVQFYHKSKLVPGVEQMPFAGALSFLKPVFAAFGGSSGGFGYQDKPSVFYTQSGLGVAPVICYESIWGSYVAEYVRQGAQFIAIITNDGWWGNTSGKDQHMEYAKLRAIETRRWVARSANTGISAFINQRGDLVKQSGWWKADALKQDINVSEELTFYVKHGDYLVFFALGVGLILLVLAFARRNGRNQAVT